MGALMAHLRAVPGVVRAVFVIAFLSGSIWALLTPAFQVPDEPGHYAYTEYLVHNGKLPPSGRGSYSTEQTQAVADLLTVPVIGFPAQKVPIDGTIKDGARGDGGGATGSTSQPPVFYLTEAVPYVLFSWGSLTTRLWAMRMLSVLFFALTAAVVAVFASELLRDRPWVPLVAGGTVALAPAMGFIAGGVSPDNLLDLLCALTLLLALRAVRAPTPRAALSLTVVAVLGALTKLTYVAFVPGAALVVLYALVQVWRADGFAVARPVILRCGAAVVLPLGAFALWAHASNRGLIGASVSTANLPQDKVRISFLHDQLSYTWQAFLPRMPWQDVQFPDQFPLQTTWLNGFLGRYGWLDYSAPQWILDWGRDVAWVLLAGLAAGLVRFRHAVISRSMEVAAALLFVGGLVYVLGSAGYAYRNTTGLPFEQVRYLFPLAAIFASAITVACSAVGRRLAPVAGVVVLGLFAALDLSGLLLTAARYYG